MAKRFKRVLNFDIETGDGFDLSATIATYTGLLEGLLLADLRTGLPCDSRSRKLSYVLQSRTWPDDLANLRLRP
jgi:hypothetical protein